MSAADPFGTADLRARVLSAWSAAPARFREDANAEEDLALGGYRDRVVIELAQNASDAAVRAGIPGRLLLRLRGDTLTVANTGAPLDPAGVESLATLRASAKRDTEPQATVGRFGVGFAATLAVSDAPQVVSTSGGVRWSRQEAYDLAAGIPSLASELELRGAAVPVLRLPFPAGGTPPEPYDTAVLLPLRDEAARALVLGLLAAVDDALLLTLPGLAEVVIESDVDGEGVIRRLHVRRTGGDVEVSDGERATRWRQVTRSGRHDPGTLADRPVEERANPFWSVTCAIPVDDEGRAMPLPPTVPRVLHAPTPTDERLSLPALVVATVPLTPSRRRSAPGPARDHVLAEAGAVYAELLSRLAVEPAILDLVPPPVLLDVVDAKLAESALAALAQTELLPAADGSRRLRPVDAVLVTGLRGAADPSALAVVAAGLVDPAWGRVGVLRRLGTRELDLVEVVDSLGSIEAEPGWWRGLYTALDGADPESLAALPVPLIDGRLVRGPRGTLLPNVTGLTGPAGPTERTAVAARGSTLWQLGLAGLRMVHPDAVHPLLERLGATPATPSAVLAHPALQGAVATWEVDERLPDLSGAILDLVAASGRGVAEEPWLAAAPMPTAAGGWSPAAELILPGSAVLDVLEGDPAELTVDPAAVSRWGADLLLALGVREGFALVRDADVPLDGQSLHDLDDEDGWVDAVLGLLPEAPLPPMLSELAAVKDLELVRPDAWPKALTLLAGDQDLRAAIVEPGYVILADGSRRPVPQYSAWWLRQHARIEGRPLSGLCLPDAVPTVRVIFEPSDLVLDHEFAAALGLKAELADLLADPDEVLARLAEDDREVGLADLVSIYRILSGADPERVEPPDRVRVPAGMGSRVADANDVVVADAPYWLQLDLAAVLPAGAGSAEPLAEVLDLPLAAEVVDARVESVGTEVDVPPAVRSALPDVPSTVIEHDELVVAGRSVEWWIEGETAHVATVDGMARALAWLAERWQDRWLIENLLGEPSRLGALVAEGVYDEL